MQPRRISSTPLDLRPRPAQAPPAQRHPRQHWSIRRAAQPKFMAAAAVTSILFFIIGFTVWRATMGPTIPRSIAEKVLFPIYLPSALPHGYQFNPDAYDTHEGVLIMIATNTTDNITFSEQAKPQDYDINGFQQKALHDPQSLPNAPYPSIIGQTAEGATLLSVQTDTTWLLVTSQASNARTNLTFIAQHLHGPRH